MTALAGARLAHAMLRVGDLDRSPRVYTGVLGMRLLRRKAYPDGRFTLAFVGYRDEAHHAVLEVTHNWDTHQYEPGTDCGRLRELGVKILRESDAMRYRPEGGGAEELIAFIVQRLRTTAF